MTATRKRGIGLNYLAPILERSDGRLPPFASVQPRSLSTIRRRLDQWGIISLAKDKLELEESVAQQILAKERRIKESIREEQSSDKKLLQETMRVDNKERLLELERKRETALRERQEVLRADVKVQTLESENDKEHRLYSQRVKIVARRASEADRNLRLARHKISKQVEEENLNTSGEKAKIARAQRLDEIRKEQCDIEFSSQRMAVQEGIWRHYFAKRVRKMERDQKTAMCDFSQTTAAAEMTQARVEQRIDAEHEKDSRAHLAKQQAENDKRKTTKRQLAETLGRMVEERKVIRRKSREEDSVQKNIWTRDYEEHRQGLLRLLRKKKEHAREYSESLARQVCERAEREQRDNLELTPEEVSVNKGLLERVNINIT